MGKGFTYANYAKETQRLNGRHCMIQFVSIHVFALLAMVTGFFDASFSSSSKCRDCSSRLTNWIFLFNIAGYNDVSTA